MSFLPLPAPLLKTLAREAPLPVLELGCGDGRLARVIADAGGVPLGLDRRPPSRGSVAAVVGDVRRPPLRRGGWRLVVAGNVLRHLAGDRARREALAAWCALLAPGGELYLLEDAPGGRTPAERNYADLQDLLAEAPGRGRLLSPRAGRELAAGLPLRVRDAGVGENAYPVDAAPVLAMLEGVRPGPATPAGRLAAAIRRAGLAYGRYWWLRLGREREAG